MKISFSPHFTVAITIIIGLIAITAWIGWVTSRAHADNTPPRAISAEMHAGCANMPRGNQEMENGRKQCFERLYEGRVKIDRRLVGRD